MPSHSEKQRRFFQLVKAVQNGERSQGQVDASVRKAAKSMNKTDVEAFANSVAEWKQKKTALSILKDIHEPMYLNEEETNPIAKTFTEKTEFEKYVARFIGQPLSPKEAEAVNTFKDAKPTKNTRNEIRYETTDSFTNSTITVVKKLKENTQFVFTAFTKHTPVEKDEPEQSPDMGMPLDPSMPAPPPSPAPSQPEKPDVDEVIVTKSVSYTDEIKGGAILAEFLKKLDI